MTHEQLRELAARALARQANGQSDPATLARAFDVLCDNLREHLEPLLGVNGVRALFGRGLHLAKASHSWLAPVQLAPPPGCALQHVEDVAATESALAIRAGLAAIVAEDLALLFGFIGEDLTLPLVQRAWPADVSTGRRTGTQKDES